MLKPVIVGEHNPQFGDPEHALWPAPPNATGARLFKLLQARVPEVTAEEYLRAFDRRNLIDAAEWDDKAARGLGPVVWDELKGRRVVLLGATVYRCVFGLQDEPTPPPIEWRTDLEDRTWCFLPHPSGRNLWYNDGANRASAGLLLEELFFMVHE